jgi:F0F1-type ATP synthase assembly protein I
LPPDFRACYTFAAPQDGFDANRQSGGITVVESWIYRVLNSAAAGRRLGLRVVATQAIATLLMALACLTIGPRAALAALAGGGAMTLGSLAAAWGAFGGGVVGGGMALGRLLLGTAVKWLVVAAGLYLAMAVWRLPAVPALAGAAIAAVAFMFAARRGTTRTNA